MPTICYEGVSVMPQITEICQGDYKSSVCTLHAQAIPEFNLPINSSVNTIIETMKVIIVSQNQRIIDLESKVSVNNTTVTPLTLAQLNVAYPLASLGLEVQCLAISTIYKKTLTSWISQSITIVV